MSDLAPIYLAVREAKRAETESAAGDLALAQFGSMQVNTDVEQIQPNERAAGGPPSPEEAALGRPLTPGETTTAESLKRGAARSTQRQASEQAGAAPTMGVAPDVHGGAPKVPLLSEQLAAVGAEAGHVATAQAAEKLGEYLFNVNDMAELQKKIASPEGVSLIEAAGLSMPFVNVAMHAARAGLEAGGVPEPYTTIGEYLAAIIIPSRVAYGMVRKAAPAAAAAIATKTAAPKSGYTRLYRAENSLGEGPYRQSIYAGEGEGQPLGRFFTASEENARNYLKDVKGKGRISYLDLPNAEQYQGKLTGEYLVPEGAAAGRSPFVSSQPETAGMGALPGQGVVAEPRAVVEQAGMQWVGVQEGIGGTPPHAMFNDPKTGSTLMVPMEGLTTDTITAKVAESRKAWGLTPGGLRNEEAAPAASLLLSKEPGAERAVQRIGDAVSDAGHAGLAGEEGRSKAGIAMVLGRAAVGALVGGTIGDTPEERFRNALTGAGVAGIAPTAVAKATRWLVEHAPSLRNAVRKPTTAYPPEVGQQLERLFSDYDSILAAARRGERPHVRAWAEADQMIRDGRMGLDEVRAAFPGMTLNDAEAGAFIKTVASYGVEVQAFAEGLQGAVRGGKPLAPEQVDQLLTRLYAMREFLPKPAGVVAEAGRTLSFMNEPTSGLNQYLAQWHQLFADPSKSLSPEKLVDIISGFKRADQHAALARAQQEPGWAGMAIEALYGSLLGNPVTLTVNALGNTLGMAYAPIERAGAAVMGDAIRWTEPFAMVYGFAKAAPKAFAYARHTFQTGERQITGYTKLDTPTGPTRGITSQWLEQTLLGKIAETAVPMGIAGAMYANDWSPESAALTGLSLHPRFWPLAPRAMVATDELFKTMLYEGEKWAQAVRRGAEIANPALRKQKILEMVQNPNSLIQAASERFANEFTFNAPPGSVLKGLIDGMNDPTQPGAYRVFYKTVVPFANVPANLTKFVGRRTPGLNFLHAGWMSDLQTPGPKQDTALGQLALGAALLAGVSAWAAEGGVTGSGPADPNIMREWIADGNQEYSVNFGDKTFSINRADPWGQMASIVADWSAIAAHIDDATNDQIAAALLMVVSKDMMSKSYFEGGANFLEAVTNKDPNKAYHWLYQYTGTPVPSLVKQQRNIHDPYLREVRDIVDAAMNRVPEFSKNLAPRKNIFAEPIVNHEPIGYGIDFVNPFNMKVKKNDPAAKAVLDNRISVSMPSWSIYGNPDKSWTIEPQRETVGVPLTHSLRDELIDFLGKPLKKEWLAYVNSKDYDSGNLGPDSVNALVFRRLHKKFMEAAVAQLVDKHPELLKGLEDALTRRANALATQQAPRAPVQSPSILERLQGAGAPAAP